MAERSPVIKSRVALEPSCPLSQETLNPWLAGMGLYRSKLFCGAHTRGAPKSFGGQLDPAGLCASTPQPWYGCQARCGFTPRATRILPAPLQSALAALPAGLSLPAAQPLMNLLKFLGPRAVQHRLQQSVSETAMVAPGALLRKR